MTSTSVTVQTLSLSDCPEQGPELVSLLKQFMVAHTLNMPSGNCTISLVFLMVLQVVAPLMVFLFSFFTGLWKKFLSHNKMQEDYCSSTSSLSPETSTEGIKEYMCSAKPLKSSVWVHTENLQWNLCTDTIKTLVWQRVK